MIVMDADNIIRCQKCGWSYDRMSKDFVCILGSAIHEYPDSDELKAMDEYVKKNCALDHQWERHQN